MRRPAELRCMAARAGRPRQRGRTGFSKNPLRPGPERPSAELSDQSSGALQRKSSAGWAELSCFQARRIEEMRAREIGQADGTKVPLDRRRAHFYVVAVCISYAHCLMRASAC